MSFYNGGFYRRGGGFNGGSRPPSVGPWAGIQLIDLTNEGSGVLRNSSGNFHGIAWSGPYTRDVEIEVSFTSSHAQQIAAGVSVADPSILIGTGAQKYVDHGIHKASDQNVYYATDTDPTAAGAYTNNALHGVHSAGPYKAIFRYASGNLEIYENGVLEATYADVVANNTTVWLHVHIVVPESVTANAQVTVLYAGPARS